MPESQLISNPSAPREPVFLDVLKKFIRTSFFLSSKLEVHISRTGKGKKLCTVSTRSQAHYAQCLIVSYDALNSHNPMRPGLLPLERDKTIRSLNIVQMVSMLLTKQSVVGEIIGIYSNNLKSQSKNNIQFILIEHLLAIKNSSK